MPLTCILKIKNAETSVGVKPTLIKIRVKTVDIISVLKVRECSKHVFY